MDQAKAVERLQKFETAEGSIGIMLNPYKVVGRTLALLKVAGACSAGLW